MNLILNPNRLTPPGGDVSGPPPEKVPQTPDETPQKNSNGAIPPTPTTCEETPLEGTCEETTHRSVATLEITLKAPTPTEAALRQQNPDGGSPSSPPSFDERRNDASDGREIEINGDSKTNVDSPLRPEAAKDEPFEPPPNDGGMPADDGQSASEVGEEKGETGLGWKVTSPGAAFVEALFEEASLSAEASGPALSDGDSSAKKGAPKPDQEAEERFHTKPLHGRPIQHCGSYPDLTENGITENGAHFGFDKLGPIYRLSLKLSQNLASTIVSK